MKDLNGKAKTKTCRENLRAKLCDITDGNDFFHTMLSMGKEREMGRPLSQFLWTQKHYGQSEKTT